MNFTQTKPKPKPAAADKLDKLPPHSPEAEQGILGCILLDTDEIYGCLLNCSQRIKSSEVFYDLRHRSIYDVMLELFNKRQPVELISIQQRLKERNQLDNIGGISALVELQDMVTSATNLDFYLTQVIEKHDLRRLIQACEDVKNRAFDNEPVSHIATDLTRALSAVGVAIDNGDTSSWNELLSFDTSHDPNNIIGVKYLNDDRKISTRYLCKGHSAWVIGPSGVGKSSLMVQMGLCFATGRPFMGINAERKLRALIVQAENDKGDMAEMVKGINHGLGLELDEDTTLNERLRFRSITGKVGQAFCAWLLREIEAFKADLVLVDPLLSFAGIDVNRQDQVSEFCRVWLDPVLRKTGAVLISVHHTGKPPRRDGKKQVAETISELAYAGLGSSELVNWARAIMLLQPVGDEAFKLVLAKRGKRACATHPGPEFVQTCVLWLKHATDGRIWWQQVEPPEEPEPETKERKGGKPNKCEQIATSNLYDFCRDCTDAGEGLNVIAKRLESYLAKQKEDVSLKTCKRIIPMLVANGKLIKNEDSLYRKGSNA